MPGPSIAIALFPRVAGLDWIGPWEVLSAWARNWPSDGASVFTVAEDSGPITCSQGARVLADHTWEDAPHSTCSCGRAAPACGSCWSTIQVL